MSADSIYEPVEPGDGNSLAEDFIAFVREGIGVTDKEWFETPSGFRAYIELAYIAGAAKALSKTRAQAIAYLEQCDVRCKTIQF